MPHYAYGPKNRDRVKRLLGVLLSYANDELEGTEQFHSDLKVNWQTEKQLVVRTKLRTLERLTEKDELPGKLTKEEIREAINHLKRYLKILVDNRERPRGAEDWHFTLELWSKDKEENLRRFDAEWDPKLPPKSKILSSTSKESGDIFADPGADEVLNEGSTSSCNSPESPGVVRQVIFDGVRVHGDLKVVKLKQIAQSGKSLEQVIATDLEVQAIQVDDLEQEIKQ